MTSYGRNGDQENTPAFDVNIQAARGLMELTGTSQSGSTRTELSIMDYNTAIVAAFAIVAELFEQNKSGNGAFIDISMLDTSLLLILLHCRIFNNCKSNTTSQQTCKQSFCW